MEDKDLKGHEKIREIVFKDTTIDTIKTQSK